MASPAIIGATLGLGMQFYVNAVRKLPLMRNPWQHAIAAGAGAAFGSWVVDFEERTEKEVAVLVAKRVDAERQRQARSAA